MYTLKKGHRAPVCKFSGSLFIFRISKIKLINVQAILRAGVKRARLVLGIDLTASNEWQVRCVWLTVYNIVNEMKKVRKYLKFALHFHIARVGGHLVEIACTKFTQ